MRFFDYLPEALGGPGRFRFYVQPLVAALVGFRMGLADFRSGRLPFMVWASHLPPGRRVPALREAFRRILVPLAIAFVLDLVLQYLILHQVRARTALVMAMLFIALPYFLARGLANRGSRVVARARRAVPRQSHT